MSTSDLLMTDCDVCTHFKIVEVQNLGQRGAVCDTLLTRLLLVCHFDFDFEDGVGVNAPQTAP